jgi:hypothetical protein
MENLQEAPVKKKRISRKTLPPGVAKVINWLRVSIEIGVIIY